MDEGQDALDRRGKRSRRSLGVPSPAGPTLRAPAGRHAPSRAPARPRAASRPPSQGNGEDSDSDVVILADTAERGNADSDVEVVEAVSGKHAAGAGGASPEDGHDDLAEDEDLRVVGAVGKVATRDLPHPRPDCADNRFVPGTAESNCRHCAQCYCYVCDVRASECKYWGTGRRERDHANARQLSAWKRLREAARAGDAALVASEHAASGPLHATDPDRSLLLMATAAAAAAAAAVAQRARQEAGRAQHAQHAQPRDQPPRQQERRPWHRHPSPPRRLHEYEQESWYQRHQHQRSSGGGAAYGRGHSSGPGGRSGARPQQAAPDARFEARAEPERGEERPRPPYGAPPPAPPREPQQERRSGGGGRWEYERERERRRGRLDEHGGRRHDARSAPRAAEQLPPWAPPQGPNLPHAGAAPHHAAPYAPAAHGHGLPYEALHMPYWMQPPQQQPGYTGYGWLPPAPPPNPAMPGLWHFP